MVHDGGGGESVQRTGRGYFKVDFTFLPQKGQNAIGTISGTFTSLLGGPDGSLIFSGSGDPIALISRLIVLIVT